MADYRNMTATEAMRHAKDVSGLTAEEISTVVGISASVVRRYLQQGDEYGPGLDRIPLLCRAMNNTVLIQWQQAQMERQPKDIPPAQSRAEVLTAVARVSASLGDAQRRLADAANVGIDPACARDVRGLIGDVIEDCRVVMAMMQHIAQCANKTQCEPLMSLHRTPRPWWTLWKS